MSGEDWTTGLPDDLKQVVTAKGFKTPADALKSYHELEGHLGNALRIPGPEASDADRKDFQAKIQKLNPNLVELPPEKRAASRPEEYDLAGVNFEGGAPSPDEEKSFRAWAVERGLTKAAAKAEWERMATAKAEGVKAQAAAQAELKKEFGATYDDEMKGLRVWAEQTSAPQDIKDAIAGGRLTVAQARYFKGLAKALGVDTREIAGQPVHTSTALSPAEAGERHAEAMKKSQDMSQPKAIREAAYRKAMEYLAVMHPELAAG